MRNGLALRRRQVKQFNVQRAQGRGERPNDEPMEATTTHNQAVELEPTLRLDKETQCGAETAEIAVQCSMKLSYIRQVTLCEQCKLQSSSSGEQRVEDNPRPVKRMRLEVDAVGEFASVPSATDDSSVREARQTFSWRGKKSSIAILENEGEYRLYRCTGTLRNRCYYRCSQCERLNKTADSPIRPKIITKDGYVVGDAHPVHHSDCPLVSKSDVRAREIDIGCRNKVREGITQPYQAWSEGLETVLRECHNGDNSCDQVGGLYAAFPDFDRVRQSSARLLRTKLPKSRALFDIPACYKQSLSGIMSK